MRNQLALLLSIAILHLPQAAHALMPPMSTEELKKESNQIVRGKIVDVVCTGKNEKTRCADLTGYRATLEIAKTIKGKRHKKLFLNFKKYEFKEGCVGSPDTVHYTGEEALYYLICMEDECRLTHWNGIEYKSRGKLTLPKCR